ncbi:MAG: hypothetical protein IPK75_06750 [Acidobacteria bacterium]|nr:hypothetical protein [Acidobacteriota bacterium]
MRVEPPYAPPYEIHAPQVPPPRPAPGPLVVALAGFLNRNASAVWLTAVLMLLAAALLWMAVSFFFSDAGLYTATALVVLIAVPRLCLMVLVVGGMFALAFLDQAVPRAAALLTAWWPLAVGLAAALILALFVERAFFR